MIIYIQVKKNATLKKRGDTLGIELAIGEYLIGHGIKQTFVSERCGWTKQKTNAIAKGKKKITAEEYGTICDAIGVPYDYFYNIVSEKANVEERE